MEKVNIAVIGSGVVGLACAYELSKKYSDILILEKHLSFGQETSSRNSEVIHAGIYYPQDSLKTKTCIEGRKLVYEYCRKNNVGCVQTTKVIVAKDSQEMEELENIFKTGLNNGISDIKLISKNELLRMEPRVNAVGAIYSPSTGIIDSHGLMKKLSFVSTSQGVDIVYDSKVVAIDKIKDGFKIWVTDRRGECFEFKTRIVVNSAGLYADKVAEMVGIKNNGYRIRYSKGDYFRVGNNKGKMINRLVYPVPDNKGSGLGIHATLDLCSGLRLGPDDQYVDDVDYQIDESKKDIFFNNVKTFLPFIDLGDLSPDTSGIRPKLSSPMQEFRDFIIKEESGEGFPGFINLIGIESPGLTSSLAIAKMVKKMVDQMK